MQLSSYMGRLVLDQTFVPIPILLHDFFLQMAVTASRCIPETQTEET
jgi:hypothetical protein